MSSNNDLYFDKVQPFEKVSNENKIKRSIKQRKSISALDDIQEIK
tara:strand:- start:347 stop:481 length:135 start_codon:yes stop_codon:yes gene_type:complete